MSAPWYAVTDPRPEAAWELYHENSKRGPERRHRDPTHRRSQGPTMAASRFSHSPTARRPRRQQHPRRDGAIPIRAFSDLLAAGGRSLTEADPVTAFVAIEAVETLPRGLAWYDPTSHSLRLLRRDDAWKQSQRPSPLPKFSAAPPR